MERSYVAPYGRGDPDHACWGIWAPAGRSSAARGRRCRVLGRRRQRRRHRLALDQRRQPARVVDRRGVHEHRADHGAPGRLPRPPAGHSAGSSAAARACGRARSADRLASLERARLHRPRRRARDLLRLGLRADGQVPDRQGDLDHALGRRLSRHDHGDDRHRDAARRRRDVARDRQAAAQLRVVVRRPSARLRRHRAVVVPRDPDRQRARPRPDGRRLLARPVRRDDRDPGRLPARGAARAAPAPPPAGRRGGRRGPRRRLGADRRAAARPSGRRARPVLPVAVPRPAPDLVGAPVLALRRARREVAADHGQGPRRSQRASRRSASGHARGRRGAVRRLHRVARGVATRCS